METIKIVSGVVDEERLTLIDVDGNSIEILQGDPRLRKILAFITDPITVHGEVDMPTSLLSRDSEDPLPFAEFEEASGVVKFFRTTKKFVARVIRSLTGKEEAADRLHQQLNQEELNLTDGVVPTQNIQRSTALEKKQEAIAEILKKAVPASSPDFRSEKVERQRPIQEYGHTDNDRVDGDFTSRLEQETEKTDTIIAVVGNEIIPGMEMIESQFKHALKLGSTQGVTNLLKRLGAVIQKRGHGIDDVLRFMQRGDLLVDDAGNIIAYKALKLGQYTNAEVGGIPKRTYVDAHTHNVHQWVGSIVEMAENLVDHNRGQECSSGLHIARRGYLTGSGFGGDVCTLVLVAPEDVIAVPNYDANKVRACRYRIVAELSQAQFQLIKANKPISDDPAGKVILANVKAGNIHEATHITEIRGARGSGLKITLIKEAEAPVLDETVQVDALPDTVEQGPDEPVNILDVQASVNIGRKAVAKGLYDAWKATGWSMNCPAYWELLAYKKQAKISWEKLGLPSSPSGNVLPGGPAEDWDGDSRHSGKPVIVSVDPGVPGGDQTVVAGPDAHKALAEVINQVAETKAKPTPKPKVAKKATKAPQKPVKAKKTMTAPTPSAKPSKPKTTPREDMATLLGQKKPEDINVSIATSALSIKQAAKKSWSVLGVSPELERAIKKKLDSISAW